MDTKAEFDTLEIIIKRLLREDERCRNNDKWLTYRVMSHFTKIYIKFEDFKRIPAFSSIDRVRRLVQKKDPTLRPNDRTTELRVQRSKDIMEIIK